MLELTTALCFYRGNNRAEESDMDVVTKPRLLDEVRQISRRHHYSVRTEKSYRYWIRFYIRFTGRRYPRELESEEIERFPTWLATARRVARFDPEPGFKCAFISVLACAPT